jgi:hypothetical protein
MAIGKLKESPAIFNLTGLAPRVDGYSRAIFAGLIAPFLALYTRAVYKNDAAH